MTPRFSRFILAVLPVALFLSFSCQPATESTVGSPQDTPIPNATVTVDTTYLSGALLYATGKVMNNGTSAISPPWYVECQFYTDSTFTLKIGGNNTLLSVPLNPGQGTFWTISFSSTNVDVRNYPKFRVKDQRAIYKR